MEVPRNWEISLALLKMLAIGVVTPLWDDTVLRMGTPDWVLIAVRGTVTQSVCLANPLPTAVVPELPTTDQFRLFKSRKVPLVSWLGVNPGTLKELPATALR